MNNLLWAQIAEDYEKAKNYLYCPKGVEEWHLEEEKGRYHLLKAYLTAKNEEEKNCLLYARILMMMYWNSYDKREYYLLDNFIKPAFAYYNQAIEKNYKPDDNEIDLVTKKYNELNYNMKKYGQDDHDLIALIDGLKEIPEFYFHDSEVLSFCIDKNNATMVLEFENVFVEFKFYNVIDFDCNIDINNQYVCDYYCFPTYFDRNTLVFTLNCGYTIHCEKISAKRIKGL